MDYWRQPSFTRDRCREARTSQAANCPSCGGAIQTNGRQFQISDVALCTNCGVALTAGLAGFNVLTLEQERGLSKAKQRVLRLERRKRQAAPG